MKPFEQLTESGQARRLRAMAFNAIGAWPIDVKAINLIAVHTNTLFRVTTSDNQKYALRICKPGEHTDIAAGYEAIWLDRLNSETDLRVPTLIRTRSGDPWVYAEADGVPQAHRCMLFEWIPGQPVSESETPVQYEQMGVMLAQMHDIADAFTVPDDFRPMSWNKTFYWPDEQIIIDDLAYAHLITPERRAVLAELIPLIDDTLGDLYKQRPPIVIHGDFHSDNVHSFRGKLYALDFADLMLGYPVQDIAITLYSERFADVRPHFEAGYRSVRDWPVQSERQLNLIMAARMVSFVNYVSQDFDAETAENFLAGWFKELDNLISNEYESF